MRTGLQRSQSNRALSVIQGPNAAFGANDFKPFYSLRNGHHFQPLQPDRASPPADHFSAAPRLRETASPRRLLVNSTTTPRPTCQRTEKARRPSWGELVACTSTT